MDADTINSFFSDWCITDCTERSFKPRVLKIGDSNPSRISCGRYVGWGRWPWRNLI